MYFILLHTSLFADIENCAKFKEFFKNRQIKSQQEAENMPPLLKKNTIFTVSSAELENYEELLTAEIIKNADDTIKDVSASLAEEAVTCQGNRFPDTELISNFFIRVTDVLDYNLSRSSKLSEKFKNTLISESGKFYEKLFKIGINPNIPLKLYYWDGHPKATSYPITILMYFAHMASTTKDKFVRDFYINLMKVSIRNGGDINKNILGMNALLWATAPCNSRRITNSETAKFILQNGYSDFSFKPRGADSLMSAQDNCYWMDDNQLSAKLDVVKTLLSYNVSGSSGFDFDEFKNKCIEDHEKYKESVRKKRDSVLEKRYFIERPTDGEVSSIETYPDPNKMTHKTYLGPMPMRRDAKILLNTFFATALIAMLWVVVKMIKRRFSKKTIIELELIKKDAEKVIVEATAYKSQLEQLNFYLVRPSIDSMEKIIDELQTLVQKTNETIDDIKKVSSRVKKSYTATLRSDFNSLHEKIKSIKDQEIDIDRLTALIEGLKNLRHFIGTQIKSIRGIEIVADKESIADFEEIKSYLKDIVSIKKRLESELSKINIQREFATFDEMQTTYATINDISSSMQPKINNIEEKINQAAHNLKEYVALILSISNATDDMNSILVKLTSNQTIDIRTRLEVCQTELMSIASAIYGGKREEAIVYEMQIKKIISKKEDLCKIATSIISCTDIIASIKNTYNKFKDFIQEHESIASACEAIKELENEINSYISELISSSGNAFLHINERLSVYKIKYSEIVSALEAQGEIVEFSSATEYEKKNMILDLNSFAYGKLSWFFKNQTIKTIIKTFDGAETIKFFSETKEKGPYLLKLFDLSDDLSVDWKCFWQEVSSEMTAKEFKLLLQEINADSKKIQELIKKSLDEKGMNKLRDFLTMYTKIKE